MSKIAVLGAGGMAREITETLMATGIKRELISYFVDTEFLGVDNALTPLYDLEDICAQGEIIHAYIGLGEGELRESLVNRLGAQVSYPKLIHPSSLVGQDCRIGIGTTIQQFATLTAHVTIGAFAQVNIYAGVSHDCIIGDYFTASPKVSVSGNVRIGNHVFLGTACTILPGVSICDHVTVGAGAVVTNDITEPGTYVGMPARKIK